MTVTPGSQTSASSFTAESGSSTPEMSTTSRRGDRCSPKSRVASRMPPLCTEALGIANSPIT